MIIIIPFSSHLFLMYYYLAHIVFVPSTCCLIVSTNGADINTTMGAWAYGVVFIALLNTVISLYYYLKIVKAMYIVRTDNPLPTFKSDCNTKFALAVCMAGILLFGVCSFVYEWIAAAV